MINKFKIIKIISLIALLQMINNLINIITVLCLNNADIENNVLKKKSYVTELHENDNKNNNENDDDFKYACIITVFL